MNRIYATAIQHMKGGSGFATNVTWVYGILVPVGNERVHFLWETESIHRKCTRPASSAWRQRRWSCDGLKSEFLLHNVVSDENSMLCTAMIYTCSNRPRRIIITERLKILIVWVRWKSRVSDDKVGIITTPSFQWWVLASSITDLTLYVLNFSEGT